jgi:hypothetical protein
MVRRRSTVRFRKGALQVRSVFRCPTGDLLWGYSSGRNRSAVRLEGGGLARPQAHGGPGQPPRIGGECLGVALWGGKIVARPASGACSPAPSRLANGHQNSPAFTSSRGSRGNSLRPAGALRSARTPEIHQILEQALPTPRVTGAMMIVTRPPASPADRAWRARCAAHPHAPGALLVASDSVATQSQQRRSGCPRGR